MLPLALRDQLLINGLGRIWISLGESERHTSGAEAHVDIAGQMYGLKPVPFTVSTFSASCTPCPDTKQWEISLGSLSAPIH